MKHNLKDLCSSIIVNFYYSIENKQKIVTLAEYLPASKERAQIYSYLDMLTDFFKRAIK